MARGKVWYRNVGETPMETSSGTPVGPGEYVALTGDEVNESAIADLINSGGLIEVDEKLAKQAQAQQEKEAKAAQAEAEQATEESGEEES